MTGEQNPGELVAETPPESTGASPESPPESNAMTSAAVQQLQALTIEQLREQLAQKDLDIVKVGQEKTRLQNEQVLTAGERDRLMGELQQAVTDRTAIETELKQREDALAAGLISQTAATQTAVQQASSVEQELKSERARRIKSEILLAEFPELAAYAEVIQPNEDAEMIRHACRTIKTAQEKALTAQRQVLATGSPLAASAGTPPRGEPAVDSTRIQAFLREGMTMGSEEYERRRKQVISQLAGS